ncbi:MAG: ChaB family protein [Rubrobacteraceae bacterium]
MADPPDSVKGNLPKHAQEIYKKAFNSASKQYDEESCGPRPRRRERGSVARSVRRHRP